VGGALTVKEVISHQSSISSGKGRGSLQGSRRDSEEEATRYRELGKARGYFLIYQVHTGRGARAGASMGVREQVIRGTFVWEEDQVLLHGYLEENCGCGSA